MFFSFPTQLPKDLFVCGFSFCATLTIKLAPVLHPTLCNETLKQLRLTSGVYFSTLGIWTGLMTCSNQQKVAKWWALSPSLPRPCMSYSSRKLLPQEQAWASLLESERPRGGETSCLSHDRWRPVGRQVTTIYIRQSTQDQQAACCIYSWPQMHQWAQLRPEESARGPRAMETAICAYWFLRHWILRCFVM